MMVSPVVPQLWERASSDLNLEHLGERVEANEILMCEPTYFNVIDAKNPFMAGNVGSCDTELALSQWQNLRATYQRLGYRVHILEAAPELEDMVFAANQVLPGQREDGSRYAILANMRHASRRREIPFYAEWFKQRRYELLHIGDGSDDAPRFEGQGDAIWHPGKNLIWGGFGHRSERAAYNDVLRLTGAHVALLELINERFYHLDTAFCPLDHETVMLTSSAFSPHGIALIHSVFKNVIEIPESDARTNFAGNAVVLGKNVILQKGSTGTCAKLIAAGYTPIEVETSEFMKAGGSVFCMKMMVF